MSEQDATLDEFVAESDGSPDMQSTPTGNFTSDWDIIKAGEYLSLRNGQFLSSEDREEDSAYPVYGGNGIMGFTSETNVEDGTVVIGRVGAYCGNVHQTKSDAWVTDNSIILHDVADVYSKTYLKYLLTSLDLGQFSEQSAQPRISQSTVENLRIPQPPVEEQRKIASVLHTVDEAIQKTEEVIEQRESVKQGILQDLFTRGLDSNLDLRPHPSEDPSLFKESSGRIVPQNYNVRRLAELGEWVSGKTPKRSNSSYWGGKIPWITAKDMKRLHVKESEDSITEKAVEEGATVVSSESVLVLVRGMILDHTLPVVRPEKETSFNQDVKAILPDSLVNPDYLAYWLKAHSNEVLALVTSASHGTKRLATEAFGNLVVPIPPEDEQEAIVKRTQSLDESIKKEEEYTDQLKRLKQGLMQDLLSGEVRTHDKDIDILDEVKQHG